MNTNLQINYNKTSAPYSNAVLVLGIVSIAMCCSGFIALGAGITALVLARRSTNYYNEDPSLFTQSSFNNIKSGKTCAIIGVCLSGLATLYYVFYIIYMMFFISVIGGALSTLPWENF